MATDFTCFFELLVLVPAPVISWQLAGLSRVLPAQQNENIPTIQETQTHRHGEGLWSSQATAICAAISVECPHQFYEETANFT